MKEDYFCKTNEPKGKRNDRRGKVSGENYKIEHSETVTYKDRR